MIYVRGHAGDYDHWQEQGATGWYFADILPYFKKMETALDGEAGWRGENGPLHISRGKQENPLHNAFMDAARQAGYALTPDYNGQRQEGFGPADMTVHNGRRWSTACRLASTRSIDSCLHVRRHPPALSLRGALLRVPRYSGACSSAGGCVVDL